MFYYVTYLDLPQANFPYTWFESKNPYSIILDSDIIILYKEK